MMSYKKQTQSVDVEESDASELTNFEGLGRLDMKNVPGSKKIAAIEAGIARPETFIAPPNMPGHKLKELRERNDLYKAVERRKAEKAAKKQAKEEIKQTVQEKVEEDADEVVYAVGMQIKYGDIVTEIIDVDEEKGVLIKRPSKKDGDVKELWTSFDKIEPVLESESEG